MKNLWVYLTKNWERLFFGLIGLSCVVFGFVFLANEKITSASAVFAIGFFSFLYSNLARFKRFKGLGFEAELWEDKQKEAADLIDRLKNVVAIYSREVVMGQIMRGRLGGPLDWSKNWALFDELVAQHGALGQAIDFTDLKAKIDHVFLFDMCFHQISAISRAVQGARTNALESIEFEFGNPISDVDGYSARIGQLNAIDFDTTDLYERMIDENVPEELLRQSKAAVEAFERDFGTKVEFDQLALKNLRKIADWYNEKPLAVTAEMIAFAGRQPN